MRLSVIVPAFNEERRLGAGLDQITSYLRTKKYEWEVLVVDDGSVDGTMAIADQYHRQYPRIRVMGNGANFGKGYSVRRGMIAAEGEFRLFTDADLSTPIRELDRFWPQFDAGHKVVIGSRAVSDSFVRVHQPWYREQMGRVFNRFVQAIALPGIHDTQCGFKAFTAEAAQKVFSLCRIPGFGFDVESLYLARKLGFRTAEVGVEWVNSPATKVSAMRDATTMFIDLLRVRAADRRGDYEAPAPGAWTGPLPRKNIPRRERPPAQPAVTGSAPVSAPGRPPKRGFFRRPRGGRAKR